MRFWFRYSLLPDLRVEEPREALARLAPLLWRELSANFLGERGVGFVWVSESSLETSLRKCLLFISS